VFRRSFERQDFGDLFDDLGIQENIDQEKKEQRNLVEELNELYTTGLCNPEHYVEKLKDLSKYQWLNSDHF
jgi:hypothetical protein